MDSILDILDAPDVCSLLFLIVVLNGLGRAFVDEHSAAHQWGLRLAAAALLLYVVYAAVRFQPASADDWLWIVIRALFAAGLAVGIAWVALGVGSFFKQRLIDRPLSRIRARSAARRERERQERERQRRAEDELQQFRRDAERQRTAANQALHSQTAQRRRANARAAADLAYSLFAPELSNRFDAAQFRNFMSTYMHDGCPPEEVEQRAQELRDLIRQHTSRLGPEYRFTDLNEMTAWLAQQREAIQRSAADDDLKQVLLIELEEQTDHLLRQFMRRV